MKKLLPFLKPYTKCFIIGPFFKLLEAVLELFMPVLMAQIIDGAYKGTAHIAKTGLLMLLLCTVGLISALICQYSAAVAASGVGIGLRRAAYEKTMRLSGSQLDHFSASTLFSRITNDVNQISSAVNMAIRLVIRAPFICIGSVIAAICIDWKLGLLVLAALPVCTVFLLWFFRKTAPLFSKVQRGLDRIGRKVGENIDGVRVVRAFNSEGYETERFAEVNEAYTADSVRAASMSSLINPVTSVILNLCIAAIVLLGGFEVDGGRLTNGELIAFISYVTQMTAALIVCANTAELFVRSAASLGRVNELLGLPDSPEEAAEGLQSVPDGDTALLFDKVSFSYQEERGDAERLALRDISFRLEKGKSLGVIGTTGSGKTTLVSLLLRYYTPNCGEITFFGHSLSEYGASALRGAIGVVPQKLELLSGSIADNIVMNRPISEEEMRTAARTAQAEEFILKRSDGYAAPVTKGGRNLSGGQKQRVAVARALAARPRLLVLDDASSALDYATDAHMRSAIRENYPDSTLLIISQRVWAIRECDEILVLDEGRQVGLGRHDELMKNCPAYREIVAAQGGAEHEEN